MAGASLKPTVPFRESPLLEGWGYSWMAGSYASSPRARYISRVARRLGAQERVRAMGSSAAAFHDHAGAFPDGKRGHNGWARLFQQLRRAHHPRVGNNSFYGPYKAASQIFVIHMGVADLANYDNVPTFKETMRAVTRRVRAAAVFEDSHPSVAFGGTWTTTTARDANSGDGRRFTQTDGSTVTITVPSQPTGNYTVCVGGLNSSGAFTGGFDWTVNGASVGSKVVVSADQITANTSPTVLTLPNVPAGATIVGTMRTAYGTTGFFDYYSIEAPEPPLVVLMLEPKLADYTGWNQLGPVPITDARVDALNQAKRDVAAEFTDGMVVTCDLDAAVGKNSPNWNGGALMGPYDLLHMNDDAHILMADALEATLLPKLSPVLRRPVVPSELDGWTYGYSYQGTWSPFQTQPQSSGSPGDPPVRWVLKPDGTVFVQGSVKGGVVTGQSNICQIDAGVKPGRLLRFPGDANGAYCEVIVDPVTPASQE
jgi:hypothetical protein